MYELIPIFAGIAAGAVAVTLDSRAARAAVVLGVALAAALVAGTVSGELAESWAFLLWDGWQGIAAAVLTMLTLPALSRATRRG